MASIVIASGEHRGDCYPLGRRTNVVGRAEALPIQVLDNRVSRKHLQVRFDPLTGRYAAIDMGSKNGVFVNGIRITAETRLRHRDRIRLGGTLLLFADGDGDVDASVLHRFKRAGESHRVTDFDYLLQPRDTTQIAGRRAPSAIHC
ncbi:MAG: FHA domain-containing protein [Sedimentisphaerales bacterium]|nr:FHA domain-containing protein [Sedimentisphaerales bacterium]